MAHIALNALPIFTEATFRNAGVSRFSSRLIDAVLEADGAHRYSVFLNDSVQTPPFRTRPGVQIRRTRLPTSRTWVRILWEHLVAPWHVAIAGADIVHSFLNVTPLAAPGRHVVVVHDLSFLRAPETHPAHRRWYLHAGTRLSARRAGAVLADSQSTRRDLIELFGVRPDKISVVYAGVEPQFHPRPEAEIEAFCAAHGVPRPFVLSVGTIEPRKNVDVLIRAFARLKREGRYAGSLVIVGGRGWMGVDIPALIQETQAIDYVRWLGYVDQSELPCWYNAADLLVYPSSYEGFGMPPLEAMASGTPVITSNRSSLPEVVGNAGITVEPRDEAALTDAMDRVLQSVERRDAMRARGLAQAQRFSWESAAETCLNAYQNVLTSR